MTDAPKADPTPRRFADLHTHTCASDGEHTPEQLVALADQARLAVLAVTDHDTIDGIPAALAAAENYPELTVIPGIEVSAACAKGTLHILGLGVDPASDALADLAGKLRDARETRNPKMLALLAELGCEITMDDLRSVAGGAGAAAPTNAGGRERILGRLHMAQALVHKGYVKDMDEAFDRYLGRGCPAYVEKDRLAPSQVIAALRAAGGLAVLAHPPQLKCANHAELECMLRQFIAGGLNGIEVYHSDSTPEQTRHYLDLARRFDLAVTGGSDYHGRGKPDVRLGHPRVPVSVLDADWLAKFRR